jgi:hypothetical protein
MQDKPQHSSHRQACFAAGDDGDAKRRHQQAAVLGVPQVACRVHISTTQRV